MRKKEKSGGSFQTLLLGLLLIFGPLVSIYLYSLYRASIAPIEVDLPEALQQQKKLLRVYGEQIDRIENNRIWFRDGSSILFDSHQKHSSFVDSLDDADVQDQFAQVYPKGKLRLLPPRNSDPGRFRCDTFFKKMYGSTPAEVTANLEEIVWCPKMIGQKIRINKRNGVAEKVKKISAELDGDTTLRPFLSQIAGSFVWRKISGTNRNSMHSYGITIDINTSQSHYWQWDCKCTTENVLLAYRNKIPWKIVEVFEKHGFIWGGKWYHYDTMHFEYRPELL